MPTSAFQRYIEECVYNNDPSVRLNYHQKQMIAEYQKRLEREKLIEEITNNVLSRISITFSSGDALNQIKDLKRAVESIAE